MSLPEIRRSYKLLYRIPNVERVQYKFVKIIYRKQTINVSIQNRTIPQHYPNVTKKIIFSNQLIANIDIYYIHIDYRRFHRAFMKIKPLLRFVEP